MIKIWAHMSIQNWIENPFKETIFYWWTYFQIFAKSPRWRFFTYDKLKNWYDWDPKNIFSKHNILWWMIHSVYLINLAKPVSNCENDRNSIVDDFKIAQYFWFDWVNVHLWKYVWQEKKEAINNMVENIKIIFSQIHWMKPYFIFENTSWQWSEIWSNFEELWEFIDICKKEFWKDFVESKLKICLDSAHLFWAWYDVCDFDNVLNQFDKNIWKNYIFWFHLNDSKVPLWSKLDRHASIWRWFIWLNWIFQIVKYWYENWLPIVIETPEPDFRQFEIQTIKDYSNWKIDNQFIEQFNKNYYCSQYLKKFENLATKNSLF